MARQNSALQASCRWRFCIHEGRIEPAAVADYTTKRPMTPQFHVSIKAGRLKTVPRRKCADLESGVRDRTFILAKFVDGAIMPTRIREDLLIANWPFHSVNDAVPGGQ
jgi:hypothetical protein